MLAEMVLVKESSASETKALTFERITLNFRLRPTTIATPDSFWQEFQELGMNYIYFIYKPVIELLTLMTQMMYTSKT